jgi:uncharacterized protein YciI
VHYLLLYDYAENAIERRVPYREAHLALAQEFQDRGELLLAGAFGDPVDGAALVFQANDAGLVESFVNRDPYVASGLVTAWRIRLWTVVVGVHAS